jgi:hypothetical protein
MGSRIHEWEEVITPADESAGCGEHKPAGAG